MSAPAHRWNRWLARRAAAAGNDPPSPIPLTAALPSAELIAAVGNALHRGETHYTTRPGVVELRQRLAARIGARGGPALDAARELIITAGEGEAVFAALLGSGVAPGTLVAARHGGGRHAALFKVLEMEVVDPAATHGEGKKPRLGYVEHPDVPGGWNLDRRAVAILNLGDSLFEEGDWPVFDAPTIVVGNLDALHGMQSFRIGYAAGAAGLVGDVIPWKQAFSICTAAPSQRAAVWALDAAAEASS